MSNAATLATAVTDAYNDHDLARYEVLHDPAARISFVKSPVTSAWARG